jgi:hypothetical protein
MAKSTDQETLGSANIYQSGESSGQTSSAEPRPNEEDLQREQLGPRGIPHQKLPVRMTPQREKKTSENNDPGHTA